MQVSATLQAGGEEFVATGSTDVEPGWTEAYPRGAALLTGGGPGLGPRIERLRQGQTLAITQSSKEQQWTEPPELLTESELLGLMEAHGIGTDASMATHLETVVKRTSLRRWANALHSARSDVQFCFCQSSDF